jgi:hypothetical protein
MKQLDRLEVSRAAILKAVRANIRLKHALAADVEINDVLPELERRINDAIASGKPFELDIAEVLREIER